MSHTTIEQQSMGVNHRDRRAPPPEFGVTALRQIVPKICHVSKFQGSDCLHYIYNAEKITRIFTTSQSTTLTSTNRDQTMTSSGKFSIFLMQAQIKNTAHADTPKHAISSEKIIFFWGAG